MRHYPLLTALFLAAAAFCPAPLPAQTSPLIPNRHFALSENTDLAGGDLQSIFNTTLEACERACATDDRCQAFTFNTRNGSCFPKGSIGEAAAYDGAISGFVIEAAEGAEARASLRRAEIGFVGDWELSAMHDQAAAIGRMAYVNGFTQDELRQSAWGAEAEGNTAEAARIMGGAVALTDHAEDWAELARLLVLAGDAGGSEQSRLYTDGQVAAVNAYLRAEDKALQHTILVVLAEVLEKQGRGSDGVKALRLAQDLQPRDDTAALLADAMGKYGFRVVEHVVQNDLASPRLCVNFSEPLVKTGVDYANFVQVPSAQMTVTSDGWQQLCIEGMEFGTRSAITLREGLPAADGQVLAQSVEISAYIRDRNPGVRFAGRGYVLPRAAEAAIPVQTVNTTKLDLSLYQVTDRNLLRAIQNGYLDAPLADWQEYDFDGQVGTLIWKGKAEVGQEVNKDVTTRLPLDEALAGHPAGVYAIKAQVPGVDIYVSPAAWQWFVVSDIGLTSLNGVDGLHVFARSLGTAKAKAGVTLDLVSRANEVLASATTDEEGYARFEPALTLGKGGAAPALVVARSGDEAGADLAFLSLTGPEFDLSDRGVEGREAAPPVDVFLTTDRGAYRAGETVYATALARDPQAKAVTGLPLTAILKRPDGVEYSRAAVQDQLGGYVFALPIAGNAPRGVWVMELFADLDAAALTRKTFLVEDFLPERIDFTQSLGDQPIHLGDMPQVSLEARYLFGAPGAGLAIEGEVLLRAAKALEGWEGYRFGPSDAAFSPVMESFSGMVTDEEGKALVDLTLPSAEDLGLPLEARVTTRVAEGSGRPIERQITRPLAPAAAMIGVKPLFKDDVVAEGQEAMFDLAGVGPDLAAMPIKANWTLSRIERNYQWYQMDGAWNWEPVTSRSLEAKGEVDLASGKGSLSVPVKWGEYELRLEQSDGKGSAVSSITFYAGWYAPADVTATPDTLDLSLDKPAYKSGDVAKLRIVPRAAGEALIMVLSNRLVAMKSVTLAEGENLVDLPVTDDWGAGVYVTASVLRPMDVASGRNPARALGLAHASIDPGKAALATLLEVPAEADPRGPLPITVKLQDLAPGDQAYVTIAAVDQGILNLTGFAPPDPQGHYFGQRKLGVGVRDLYGRLIDGLNGAEGSVRSGGDAGAQARLQAPPPTEELVAFFSGPITVAEDGTARVSLDLPAFNGTVKVMALAWSAAGVGQASADVLVRDPVVVTASLPRFATPGDDSRLLLEFVHASGPSGRMGLDVSTPSGGITLGDLPSGIDLADKGKAVVEIPLRAEEIGLRTIDVALTTPDGKVLRKTLSLPIQRNDQPALRVSQIELASGQEFTLDANALDGLVPGTGKVVLAAGPIARLNAPGLLAALDAYPYGCTEQITSKAMPLLYFDQVAAALKIKGGDNIRTRIEQAIAEVLTNQSANGAFGLWGPASGDMWLDAYVTDFLSRARAQGFAVPDTALRMALDNLRNQVNYQADFDYGGEALAYALMVLAREGAAAIGDLRYYADVKGDAFATPTAMAQLGAALAAYGDQPRADAMFARAAAAVDALPQGSEEQIFRADYGTHTRDRAAVLALAAEAGSTAVDQVRLTSLLAPVSAMSTQEASWSLLAAKALLGQAGSDGLLVNGQPATGPLVEVIEASGQGGDPAPVVIRNTGPDTLITLTTKGIPTQPVPAGGAGYAISRSYYHLDGSPADLAALHQGDRLVVVLDITPYGRGEARIMVNDPLPAGLEIDNPSLLASGSMAGLDWLDTVNEVAHSEFRQDRFLTAIDRTDNSPFRLAYQVRAISPGSFHHPAPSVEDMYRPDLTGRGEEGRLTIAP